MSLLSLISLPRPGRHGLGVGEPEADAVDFVALYLDADAGALIHVPQAAPTALALGADRQLAAVSGADDVLGRPRFAAMMKRIEGNEVHIILPQLGRTWMRAFDDTHKPDASRYLAARQ